MWRPFIRPVRLLAVVGVAVAGCASAPTTAAVPPPSVAVSGAPSASATGPGSASASPTPSPTPSSSATPFVSSADEAGAYAFVKAYFAELNRAYATGDVSRLKLFREPTCICVRSEKLIVSTYTAGGRISGVSFAVLGWAFGAHGPAFARTAISFHMPSVRHEFPGKPSAVEPPVDGDYAIDLRRHSGYWVISDIRFKQVD
jgi:Family of unknown function (DUF6318)